MGSRRGKWSQDVHDTTGNNRQAAGAKGPLLKFIVVACILLFGLAIAAAKPVSEPVEVVEAIDPSLSSFWPESIQIWGPLLSQHQVNPDLLAAIMYVESRGQPEAISRAGAVGLMQVMPQSKISDRPPTQELLNPEFNIQWGVRVLEEYTAYFEGDLYQGLAAYYMGPSRAHEEAGRWYADKVLALYARSLLVREE